MTGVKQVWEVIQEYNARLPPSEHLTTTGCLELSVLIKRCQALQPGLPLTLGLAALAQESLFWPRALNDNGEPENLLAHDVGIAQLHIGSIVNPQVEPLSTPQRAVEFALDPPRAVQYAFSLLAHHVRNARAHLWPPGADVRCANPFWVACVFYNSGARGGTQAIQEARVPEHAARVAAKEVHIADLLGRPSVMNDALP